MNIIWKLMPAGDSILIQGRRDEDGGGSDDDYLITMNVAFMWGWVDTYSSRVHGQHRVQLH